MSTHPERHGSLNPVRPVLPRDPDEHHRTATPLELLFDLVVVIAIASAAAGLHHAIAEAHALDGILRFAPAFFAIWWAWMNYTWFASAYDNDDVLFRILTFIAMAGALMIAVGVKLLFDSFDLTFVIAGYVVMRVSMIALWLRAAAGDAGHRSTAATYAAGIALVQLYWIALLFLQPMVPASFVPLFLIGGLLELAVPIVAERKGPTPWHRHHIVERYGLLMIIVLGETLLSAAMALQTAFADHFEMGPVSIVVWAIAILAALWWLYFAPEEHLQTTRLDRALMWGYGHVLIFASGAAVGSGFAVLVDIAAGHAEIGPVAGSFAVAIPVAFYMLGLWFVRDRVCLVGAAWFVLPVFAVLVLTSATVAPGLVAAVTAASVFVRTWLARNVRT